MISKDVDHLPLYRLEQIAALAEITLARSTLVDWVDRYDVALQLLTDRLSELLKQRCLLHADEKSSGAIFRTSPAEGEAHRYVEQTPVQQFDPSQGKTKRAYFWAYRSGDLEEVTRITIFDYQTGRGAAHSCAFLDDCKDHMVVDDYAG